MFISVTLFDREATSWECCSCDKLKCAHASEFNIDNRLMYTIGAGAKVLGLLDADVVIGIPFFASGKSIYFDRK